MASTNDLFLGILFVALIVLVIFCVIICIKLLYTVDKLNTILTDLEKKMKSVNGLFSAIDAVTDTMSAISDTIVSKALVVIDKFFKKK